MTKYQLRDSALEVCKIVAEAGGELVGRTKLHKTAYLIQIMGLGAKDFQFQYKHYGPYSENLAFATEMAQLFGNLREEKRKSSWGGTYSIFQADRDCASDSSPVRLEVVSAASNASSVDLELAATAAYLARENFEDPWGETTKRKPDKAASIQSAKRLYRKLLGLDVPTPLPDIV